MSKAKASAAVWVVWIILTILIAGGLVYYYQFTKIPELNKKIDDLQDQINQLQEQAEKPVDETASWLTKNLKCGSGSSIKYPTDWFYKYVPSDVYFYELFANNSSITTQEKTLTGDQLRLVIECGPNNTPTQTFAKTISDEQNSLAKDHPRATFETKTIADMDTLVCNYTAGAQKIRIYYFVKKDATAFLTGTSLSDLTKFDKLAETFILGSINSPE
jgi:hypothetical protein